MSKSDKKNTAAKLAALQGDDNVGDDVKVDNRSPEEMLHDLTNRDYGANDHVTSAEGDALMKEAAKKLNKFSLFADPNRYSKCIELYENAAKCYRMNENWTEAATACEKAAELAETKMNATVDAASFYCRAAKDLLMVDTNAAISDFQLAVQLHMGNGRIGSAAKIWSEIGELLFADNRVAEALECYQKAAACHEAEGTIPSAVQCYLDMAPIYVDNEDYNDAAELYQKAAEMSIMKNINVGSVVDYWYRSMLCAFADESKKGTCKGVKAKMKDAIKQNRRNDGTREFEFVKKLIDAFDNDDVDKFTKVVKSQNKIRELDKIEMKVLLQIKRNLQDGPVEDAEDAEEINLE